MSAHSLLEDRHGADTEERLPVQVLLIYQDFSTGLRARQIIEQTMSQLDSVADFELTLWKFELLEEPAPLEWAVNEAAGADIVLLSAHAKTELPAAVKLWLQRWLRQKRNEPGALALSLDADAAHDLAVEQMLESVQGLAGPAGVEVFLHRSQTSPREREIAIENVRPSTETRKVELEESPDSAENQPFAHWGINE